MQKSYQAGGLMSLGGLETITEKNKLSRQQQIDYASLRSLIDLQERGFKKPPKVRQSDNTPFDRFNGPL